MLALTASLLCHACRVSLPMGHFVTSMDMIDALGDRVSIDVT